MPIEQSGHETVTVMFNSRDGIAGRRGDATATAITHAAAHLVARHQDPTVGVVVDSSNHIAVVNNLIHDMGGSGIAAIHSDHVRSEGNQIWGTTLWSPLQESAINYFELADSNSGPGVYGFNNAIVGNIVFHNETRVANSDGIVTDGNCINIDSSRNRGYTGATAIVNNVCVANGPAASGAE